MALQIEDETLRGLQLTEAQVLLALAVGLFTEQRVTLGQAAAIARVPQLYFQQELGRRSIPVHYDLDDLQSDLKTLDVLKRSK